MSREEVVADNLAHYAFQAYSLVPAIPVWHCKTFLQTQQMYGFYRIARINAGYFFTQH